MLRGCLASLGLGASTIGFSGASALFYWALVLALKKVISSSATHYTTTSALFPLQKRGVSDYSMTPFLGRKRKGPRAEKARATTAKLRRVPKHGAYRAPLFFSAGASSFSCSEALFLGARRRPRRKYRASPFPGVRVRERSLCSTHTAQTRSVRVASRRPAVSTASRCCRRLNASRYRRGTLEAPAKS